MVTLPKEVRYPLVVVPDLHGHRDELERLIAQLERREDWGECAVVFLGDFVDRGPDVPGTIETVLKVLQRPAGGSAVMGNHDLALIRAARLDDGPTSPFWVARYRDRYPFQQTFQAYLGRAPDAGNDGWARDLEALKEAIPREHRDFLSSLPWLVEAPGHLFLHCGLSHELGVSTQEQVQALHRRQWDRLILEPRAGTDTDLLWQDEYPVWIGADRRLSESPLPYPGRVQVTGHIQVAMPDVNQSRIRLDTSGGSGSLTACLLSSVDATPLFVTT